MARLLLIVALVAVAFWVYSIVDCAVQPPTRHRGVSKPIWLLIVIVFPVLGGILWFVIGRASFTKISAVEGIRLKPAMKKRASEASAKSLSAEEYRQTIVRSYRKG